MRMIERATIFKRDYKRIKTNPHHKHELDLLVSDIVTLLLTDQALPEKNRDHALTGNWEGYRECHIKPDLLLIYRKPDHSTLRLARLGSHSDLFD
ncbi:MAG: type II toxin-antitoxin system YafQ family toxin [Legionellales bacterium]|nr:type II toxin-antitoxin system YafQ family toxin [Legionellales bacterium]